MGLPHEDNKHEIENLKAELDLVKDVLGNFIAWSGRELGTIAQQQLMDRLYPDGFEDAKQDQES